MLELCSIASGSSGNCIMVGDDHTRVLIDAGISGKRIEAGLNEADYTTKDMQGILVTHEHIDHIAGLGTHEELLAENSVYQEIYYSQQEGVSN